jgi:hypothetical protein
MRPAASPAKSRATLLAVCAGLTGCASAYPDHASMPLPQPEFVVASNAWISGALRPSDRDADPVGCHSAWRNLALRAEDPWLGTIGLRQVLPNACELGVGIALPSSYFGVQRSDALAARPADDLGIGLWLKIDF